MTRARLVMMRGLGAWTRPLAKTIWRLRRGLTLGVQGIVTDEEGAVLLIQQTYAPGWRFPGGGVERGETAEAALARELREEAGVALTGRARLLSIHSHHARFKGDHVLVYRVEAWRPCAATAKGEIAALGWFDPASPPPHVTPATRRRLDEAFGGAPADPEW